MFSIFQNDVFYSFWQNLKTDNWAPKTIAKLNISDVSIVWHEGISNPPEFYRFDENKNLIVQSKDENDVLVDGVSYPAEPYSF